MKIALCLIALLVFLPQPSFAAKGDYVVLLHGIGRTKDSMEKMGESLTEKGYVVINIDYASRDKKIEDLVVDVREEIVGHHIPAVQKINLVGHSMGGLIIRAYIHKYKPENLGRVVMLGTPNQGSEVADLLSDTGMFKAFYGPAGQELVTDQTAFKKIFGTIHYDLGIIAGDRSIDPLSSLVIPGDDDGKVAVKRTKIKGMKDHIVVHATHTFMPSNETVMEQTEYFLEHGKFLREPGVLSATPL